MALLKKMCPKLFFFVLSSFSFFLSGCSYYYESSYIHLKVNTDLSGSASVEYKGVGSIGDEMDVLYDLLDKSFASENRIKYTGIDSIRYSILNTTSNGCDVVFSGEYDHLLYLLLVLFPLDEFISYSFELKGNRFSARFLLKPAKEPSPGAKAFWKRKNEEGRNLLTLRYLGVFLDHNAHQTNPGSHEITWIYNHFQGVRVPEIYFVLEVPNKH